MGGLVVNFIGNFIVLEGSITGVKRTFTKPIKLPLAEKVQLCRFSSGGILLVRVSDL